MDNFKEIIQLVQLTMDGIESRINSVLNGFEILRNDLEENSDKKEDQFKAYDLILTDLKLEIERLKNEFRRIEFETKHNIENITDQLKDNKIIKLEHSIEEIKKKQEEKQGKSKKVREWVFSIVLAIIATSTGIILNKACDVDKVEHKELPIIKK